MSAKITRVRLFSKLGKLFGREYDLAVSSPAEAISALCTQIPGFEQHLMEAKDKGVSFAIVVDRKSVPEDKLVAPVAGSDICIIPVISGRKSGWVNIVVGAVLVVVGALVYVSSWGLAAPVGTALIGMGASLIAGGIVQLLSPQPKSRTQEDPENTPNTYFSGPVNTQAQGQPVAVLLGELIVGSAVISAGIETKDNAYVPSGQGATGRGSSGGGGSAVWHEQWAAQ